MPPGQTSAPVLNVPPETFTAEDFRFTTKGNTLYATAMGWPAGGRYVIRTLTAGAPGIRGEGLTPGQFGLLEALLHLGPLEPCDLGPKLLTSRPNVVLLVDQLEERGLVRRRPVEGDRRRVRIELTPAGQRKVKAVFTKHVRRVVEVFAPLSAAEQEQLAALCKRLGRSTS